MAAAEVGMQRLQVDATARNRAHQSADRDNASLVTQILAFFTFKWLVRGDPRRIPAYLLTLSLPCAVLSTGITMLTISGWEDNSARHQAYDRYTGCIEQLHGLGKISDKELDALRIRFSAVPRLQDYYWMHGSQCNRHYYDDEAFAPAAYKVDVGVNTTNSSTGTANSTHAVLPLLPANSSSSGPKERPAYCECEPLLYPGETMGWDYRFQGGRRIRDRAAKILVIVGIALLGPCCCLGYFIAAFCMPYVLAVLPKIKLEEDFSGDYVGVDREKGRLLGSEAVPSDVAEESVVVASNRLSHHATSRAN